MKTICIIGTDWFGPDPTWIRQPFLDGGRLHFDRQYLVDWQNVFYELGDLAKVDALAVGIRGAYDTGAVDSLPIASAAYSLSPVRPPLLPWFDTVGLPDIAGDPGMAHPFDFANPEHIQWGWERYAAVFFDAFGGLPLAQSGNGKVLVVWWGIETGTGYGFQNQHEAQRLLDYIDIQLVALGFGPADHIVDQSWVTLVPNLQVHGVHDWFSPWGTPPESYSVRTYNGITAGVVVPSFYHRIEPEGGETLRHGLAGCRAAEADYVLLEGGTDFQEAAELMRDASGDTTKLAIIREHIALTHDEEAPVSAVSTTPLFVFDHAAVIHNSDGTKSLRWNLAAGKTDRTSTRVFSLQPDGTIEDRLDSTIGAWEKGAVEGDRLVFRVEDARATFAWQS